MLPYVLFVVNLPPGCLHVMGSLSRRGAGVAEAVWNLALAQSRLASASGTVRVLGLEDDGEPFNYDVPSIGFRAIGPTPPGYVPGLAGKIFNELRDGDILHSHGHWLHANWAAYAAARRAGKRVSLVISPHGMLGPEPMRHSPLRKRIALSLFERRALNEAHCVIAASEREATELSAMGIRSRIETIPFGIWPEEYAATPEQADREWADLSLLHPRLRRGRYILFLGRLAAIKAPLDLLKAGSELRDHHADFQLVFAGPDGGEKANLEKMIRERNLESNTVILPPVSGAMKRALLRGSRLLALCSRYESFGLVVLESLASGRPALASSDTPWSILEEQGCGWNYTPLTGLLGVALLRALAVSDAELDAMGARGVEVIRDRYAWPAIASDMTHTYAQAAEAR